VFHALQLSQNGLDYLFVRSLTWSNDWPVIGSSTDATSEADHPTTKQGRRTSRSHTR
jgi:hypothetical protein